MNNMVAEKMTTIIVAEKQKTPYFQQNLMLLGYSNHEVIELVNTHLNRECE